MNYEVITPKEAEENGYTIEGEVAFLFDLGCTTAILGFNSLDKVWQFDTGVNEEMDTWQFIEPDLHKAIIKAEHVSEAMRGVTKFLTLDGVGMLNIDFVGILNVIFEGCTGVGSEPANAVKCSLCNRDTSAKTAHVHQGEWIGDDCCWDERLRSSE